MTHPAGEAKRRAVFLDRDGTLNPDPGYISRPEDFHLFPAVPKALFRLKEAGFLLVLVTNQSGIARGIISPIALEKIHEKLQKLLRSAGAEMDAIFVCPHHPDFPQPGQPVRCPCRKPEPGLFLAAIGQMGIDPSVSFAVGDKLSDATAALAAGVDPILLADRPSPGMPGLKTVPTLADAVDHILGQTGPAG